MLKIAVCDDEQNMLIKVKKIAGHFFWTHCVDCDIHAYENSDNLQYDLKDGVYYDLFLLDIEMPGVDGMALAKEISACLPAAKILFITSHLEYAIAAYEYSVFRYIPKDMIDRKLPVALEDFYKLYDLERNDFYMIMVKNRVGKISYRDILYILKDGKYAVFYIRNGITTSVRKTLAQVFEEIGSEYFYFADRGCIVNLANVIGLHGEEVQMADGVCVAISKGSVSDFKSILLHFWEKQI